MKGAILEKGFNFYTYMSHIFNAIHNVQNEYNWLITNFEAYPSTQQFAEYTFSDYTWLTGNELTAMVKIEDFQWVWAVLSGFPKSITKEQVLQHSLPYADGYMEFWKKPIKLQHPLADVEIVSFDSALVLVISNNDIIVDNFLASMPLAENLEAYNKS